MESFFFVDGFQLNLDKEVVQISREDMFLASTEFQQKNCFNFCEDLFFGFQLNYGRKIVSDLGEDLFLAPDSRNSHFHCRFLATRLSQTFSSRNLSF